MKSNMNPTPLSKAKHILLATSAIGVAVMPSAAWAQNTDVPPVAPEVAQQGAQAGQPNAPISEVPTDTNEVVVTGIRAALDSAREIKRSSATFVDSISASDIATLPDLSVAEAIGRIPGVTISRFPTGGASPDFPSPEGRGNLIRGLGFTRSEFNGRDAFSANGGRSLDFSSIPPELVGGVDVYKNQTADLIEGGIGGTINLRTLEPFDRPGNLLVIAGDATYSDLRKRWGPQGSITGSRRWSTGIGDFGITGSVSYSRLDSRIHGWQQNAPMPRVLDAAGNVPERADLIDGAKLGEFTGVDPSQIIGITPGFQMRTNDVDRERTSYYLAGQWKNDKLQLTAKWIRADTTIDSVERTFEWFPEHNTGTTIGINNIVLDRNFASNGLPMCSGPGGVPVAPGDCETLIPTRGGLMESGFVTNSADSWTGAYGSPVGSLGIGKIEESQTDDFSLNLKWQFDDRLLITLDGQYTKATARQRQIWGGMNSYFNWQIDQDLNSPQIQFFIDPRHRFNAGQTRFTGDRDANAETGDPGVYIPSPTGSGDFNGANLQFVADQFQVGEGDLYALRADLNYDLSGGDGLASWFDSVRFGGRFAERQQTNSEMALNWGSMAPAWDGRGGYAIAGTFQNPQEGFEAVNFGNFFRGGVVNGPNQSFVFMNQNLLKSYDTFRNYILDEPQLGTNHGWVPRGTADGTRFGSPTFRPEDTSDITERTFNAYVRFDFKQQFSNGMSVDANVGLRYVRTELGSAGFRAFRPFDPDAQTEPFDPETGERTRTDDAESRDAPQDFLPQATAYGLQAAIPIGVGLVDERWLPSVNVKWNLNREMLVRAAYSKGLTRPNVQDLRASQEYVVTTNRVNFPPVTEGDPLFGIDRGAQNITVGDIRVSRGNPFLQPTTADSFDLSYEWYFRGGFLSISGFYKDLQNIITNGDLPLGETTLDGQRALIIYNGPINQATAQVKGVEVAYQQFFDFLPGALKNLGFQGNYTFVDASTTPPGNGVDANGDGNPDDLTQVFRYGVSDLLGQSKHFANAVAIYQNKVVEARLAYNWRSSNLLSYRDYVTGNPIYQKAVGFLDASLKFNIDNFQIRGSIANLLDTKSKAVARIDGDGQEYDRFSFLNDRRIVIGALMRF